MPFPRCTAKFRAICGRAFIPGKPEDAVPIGHITNGVHVPSWLAPQMFRLYDRHLGMDWQEAQRLQAHLGGHRERRRRRTLGDAPRVSNRSCSTSSGVARANRPNAAPSRAESLQRLARLLSPDALTIGFARRFATYKRANLLLSRYRASHLDGERSQASRAVCLRRQSPSARRARQACPAADCRNDARLRSSPISSSLSRTTTSMSAAISSRASTSGSTIPAARSKPPAPADRKSC